MSTQNSANKRPAEHLGRPIFIVDDKGHLLPGFKKENSFQPDFRGTWQLPNRHLLPKICPTGRSQQGLERLRKWGLLTPHRQDQTPGSSSAPVGGRQSHNKGQRSHSNGRQRGGTQEEPQVLDGGNCDRDHPVSRGLNPAAPPLELTHTHPPVDPCRPVSAGPQPEAVEREKEEPPTS